MGYPIPVLVQPVVVSYGPPREEEIVMELQSLYAVRAGVPSGMWTEHLNMCLREATMEKNMDRPRWEALVSMAQLDFREWRISAELTCTTMIILQKGKGGYRSIGLVEATWKIITTIINSRLRAAISLHDSLHGFRHVRGAVTATVEAKLAQQMAGILHEPLFQVFLDLKSAYDYFYRTWCMEILWG